MATALLIQSDSTTQHVTPANGEHFTLEEMQQHVGGYIEVVRLGDGTVLIVNEDGKPQGQPRNEFATRIFQARVGRHDHIVGNVLRCDEKTAGGGEKVEDHFQDDYFGNVIVCYTRKQAIDDGVLWQLSGPGYTGDAEIPKLCREAGFKIPIAITATAMHEFVHPLPESSEVLRECQDANGRLWDVLWMTLHTMRTTPNGPNKSTLMVKLSVVPNGTENDREWKPAVLRTIKCVCGPDDDGSPCLTYMLPHED